MNSDLVEDCSKGSIMVSGPAGFSSHACTFLPVASFILWQTLPSTHAQHSEGFLRCLWYQPAGPGQLHLGVAGEGSHGVPAPSAALSPCTAQPQSGLDPGFPPCPRLVSPSVPYTGVFKTESLKTDLCSGSFQGFCRCWEGISEPYSVDPCCSDGTIGNLYLLWVRAPVPWP